MLDPNVDAMSVEPTGDSSLDPLRFDGNLSIRECLEYFRSRITGTSIEMFDMLLRELGQPILGTFEIAGIPLSHRSCQLCRVEHRRDVDGYVVQHKRSGSKHTFDYPGARVELT